MRLSSFKDEQLKQVTGIIVNAALPEKIFLLGVSYMNRYEETIFTASERRQPMIEYVAQYQLLVLTKPGSKTNLDELQDMIESRCNHTATPVSIYRESIEVFNSWLQAGHPFACHVYNNGYMVYDAGITPLAEPGSLLSVDVMQEFAYWDNHVSEFLVGADVFRLRKQYPLAAFFLHQAAEQALTIFVKMSTGYRVVTHNLEKLLKYARPFCIELDGIFNRQKEPGLFKLLQQAYISSRYKGDYSIKEKEVDILIERVKRLQEIIRKAVNGSGGLN